MQANEQCASYIKFRIFTPNFHTYNQKSTLANRYVITLLQEILGKRFYAIGFL